jgi:hypothetical protein
MEHAKVRKALWASPVFAAVAIVAATVFVVTGCSDTERVWGFSPIYLSYAELRAPVMAADPVDIGITGKIYVKDSYIYINELYQGIHVIDNSDPSSPQKIAFIPIPGNVDMAIKGTTLYADSYVDLVAIDIADPLNAVEVARIEDALPYMTPSPWIEVDFVAGSPVETPDESLGVVVGWEQTLMEREVVRGDFVTDVALESPGWSAAPTVANGTGASGTGGSMARFTIVDPYLYVLHDSYIQLVRIDDPVNPSLWSKVDVGWGIETIFPYGNYLFIGSTTGMFIYDNTDPESPTKLSAFAHVTSCDPVVAQGDYAYVTLRAGSFCGGGVNRLDILDITDLTNPLLVESHAMQGPFGLGIDGGTLFVCDGVAGLKVYDVTDPMNIDLMAFETNNETYDVILIPPLAIVVGPDGLDQYDYTDVATSGELVLLSHLDVVNPLTTASIMR